MSNTDIPAVTMSLSVFLLSFFFVQAAASQQIQQAAQAVPVKQQNKTQAKTQTGTRPQPPTEPTKVTIDGPVAVINQPDPKNEQREADDRAETQFSNRVQAWTLVFVGIATFGAIGAYWASLRQAKAFVAAKARIQIR